MNAAISGVQDCACLITEGGFFAKSNAKGFALDKKRIATAQHVTEGLDRENLYVNGQKSDVVNIFTSSELLETEDDLAIIELGEPHLLPTPPLFDGDPQKGDQLFFVRSGNEMVQSRIHAVGRRLDVIFDALISQGIMDLDDPHYAFGKNFHPDGTFKHFEVYYTGLAAGTGDSGSPVFNHQNQVIGLVSGGVKFTEQTLLATAKAIRALHQKVLQINN